MNVKVILEPGSVHPKVVDVDTGQTLYGISRIHFECEAGQRPILNIDIISIEAGITARGIFFMQHLTTGKLLEIESIKFKNGETWEA